MATGSTDRLADYVPVSDRILQFYAKYETGRIVTTILEHDREQGFILMRAEVYRLPDDAQPASTGHAYEVQNNGFVNKTSYIENCETGAAGRALALMGFSIKKGIASREEMEKVDRMKDNGKAKSGKLAQEHIVDKQTPEQEERDKRVRHILEACGLLKDCDAQKLTTFVNTRFGVEGGINSLSNEQVRELQQIMNSRVDKANANV